MAITFNNKWLNVQSCAYYDASATTYTQRGATRQVKNCDVFPDSGVDVGDAFIFAIDYSPYYNTIGAHGKANKVKVNLDVGVAASSWDGVWEYVNGGTNAVPTWGALTIISDGTNKLRTTGSQTIEFEVPDDWDNFHLTNIGGWIYYTFMIRFRITTVAGLTEGGHIIDSNDNCQSCGYTIYVSGYTSNAPCTFNDIYNASVAGGWGVVTKNANQYIFNCNLCNGSGNYISTKQEQIIFNTNFFMTQADNTGTLICGEIYSGNKTIKGSSFIFIGKNCNYPGSGIAGANSQLLNSQFRHYWKSVAAGYNGYWGGGFGGFANQTLYDVYVEGFRNMAFDGADDAIIGVRHTAHIEGSGAIIAEGAAYNCAYGQRLQNTFNTYIHAYDFSKVTNAPFNPYLYNRDNNDFYAVDCDYGTFTTDKYAYWSSGSGTNNKIWIIASFLLKVVDESGNAISGATVTLKDKNGDTSFSYLTNADGYPGQDSGAATGYTASTLSDTSKSWTSNQWRWREIYITSGSGAGQRRYIKYQTTPYTTLNLAPDFQTIPATNDRYIIIPYVNWLKITPAIEETTSGVWSIATEYNPFTLTISKSGYKTYKSVLTLTKKFDQVITLQKVKDLNFSKYVKRISQ